MSFGGSVTKQIRDFRTFMGELAFFKTFQRRNPNGGFADEPEYPAIAIDEAIVNAVAHRDYAIKLPILCEKYADAFLVRSPGVLRHDYPVPQHFTLDELKLDHLPRNAKLIDWLKQIVDHAARSMSALCAKARARCATKWPPSAFRRLNT